MSAACPTACQVPCPPRMSNSTWIAVRANYGAEMKHKAARKRGDLSEKATAHRTAHHVGDLTRAIVAVRLGKTVSGVRHLEGRELHPKKVDGIWMFDGREVEEAARRLGRERENELSRGELAARACELFRQGKDAVDVVIALRQPFDVVLPLQRAFAEESGGLIVSRTLADQLAHICDVPRITAEILLHALEQRDHKIDDLAARLHDARVNSP